MSTMSAIDKLKTEPDWETCEIQCERESQGFLARYQFSFWAKAVGPQGEFDAGDSPVWRSYDLAPMPYNQVAQQALAALQAKLIQEGWEDTGNRGVPWWNHHYRRRVKRET